MVAQICLQREPDCPPPCTPGRNKLAVHHVRREWKQERGTDSQICASFAHRNNRGDAVERTISKTPPFDIARSYPANAVSSVMAAPPPIMPIPAQACEKPCAVPTMIKPINTSASPKSTTLRCPRRSARYPQKGDTAPMAKV